MSFFSLPQYPLPSQTGPEDSRGDIDWRSLLSRLFIYGIFVLFIGLMLLAVALFATFGQILGRLQELFER